MSDHTPKPDNTTFSGGDSVEDAQSVAARVTHPVQFEVTDWVPLLEGGLAITGWMVDPLECVLEIKVTSGERSCYLSRQNCIWIPNPDVQNVLAPALGVSDRNCGFVAYVNGIHRPGEQIEATVETTLGNFHYKFRPLRARSELASMKRLLGCFDLKYAELANAFDRVFGPSIEALNKARLIQRPLITELNFGVQPRSPTVTVIVPLYGRVDFMEHQLAYFSADDMQRVELVYVLDDPAQRSFAEFLAESCYARFQIPFRFLVLDRNVGYAVASNIGAGHARARHLCLLNSDVFPCEPGWLPSLIACLTQNPRAGVIGPRLVYEDGSLQHDGCSYEQNVTLAGWHFVVHPGKGCLPPPPSGVKCVAAISGACMVMRRDLFAKVGGFDDRYAVGDFEDSDLCQKIRQQGLQCLVNDTVVLYHLERASQASSAEKWRSNLTLYNAWQHERRWSKVSGAFAAVDC